MEEVDVAGVADGVAQVDGAVPPALPAAEDGGAEVEAPGAVEAGGGRDGALAQRGEEGHGLEGGPGGVFAQRGAVEEGAVGVGEHLLPEAGGDGGDEGVGVVAGDARQGQDVAAPRIDHDRRAALAREGVLGGLLDAGVDGEGDGAAVAGGALGDFVEPVAGDVHLQIQPPAVGGLQDAVAAFFDTAAPGHLGEVEVVALGVAVVVEGDGEVGFRGASDVA